MDEGVVIQILPGRDGRNSVLIITRHFEPCIFMRPEELNGVAFTQRISVFRYLGLVRTHDNMQRVYLATVVYDGVISNLNTNPFTFPFVYFLTIGVEGRINGVTQIHRHILFAHEDGITMVDVEVRNDGQVYIDDRVATAFRLVFKRRQPSFTIGRI